MARGSGKCPTELQRKERKRTIIYHPISKAKLELRLYVNVSSKPEDKMIVISIILQMLNVDHSSQIRVFYATHGWNGSHNVFLHFLKVFSECPSTSPSVLAEGYYHTLLAVYIATTFLQLTWQKKSEMLECPYLLIQIFHF